VNTRSSNASTLQLGSLNDVWTIPGVLAAHLRVLREVAGKQVAGVRLLPPRVRGAPRRRRPRGAVHDVQAGGAHGVRGVHDGGVADAALLQRRAGAPGRHRVSGR
jgi:hypothetical protein